MWKSKIFQIFWLRLICFFFFFFGQIYPGISLGDLFRDTHFGPSKTPMTGYQNIYIYFLRYQIWTQHPRVPYQSKERQTCLEGIDFILKWMSTVNNKIHPGSSALRHLKSGKRNPTKIYRDRIWYNGNAFINNLVVIVLFSAFFLLPFSQKVDRCEKQHVS